MKDVHLKDPSLLIGLKNFLKMVCYGTLAADFLPFLSFVDAAQKQFCLLNRQKPIKPHRDCSIYFGNFQDIYFELNS